LSDKREIEEITWSKEGTEGKGTLEGGVGDLLIRGKGCALPTFSEGTFAPVGKNMTFEFEDETTSAGPSKESKARETGLARTRRR
jgi:hypothetical protein